MLTQETIKKQEKIEWESEHMNYLSRAKFPIDYFTFFKGADGICSIDGHGWAQSL